MVKFFAVVLLIVGGTIYATRRAMPAVTPAPITVFTCNGITFELPEGLSKLNQVSTDPHHWDTVYVLRTGNRYVKIEMRHYEKWHGVKP
jgi:hypothetical protein